jgi:prephenate dehydrogenase
LNVAILGLGLIGGSVGLAARGSGAHVVGFDPDPQTRATALAAGAVDAVVQEPQQALADADVVVAAAPVGALAEIVRMALREAPAGCVVSDVGSTKRALVRELAGEPGSERFIGGHPLAGAEQGGVERARADLFAGACWCLMPSPQAQLAARLRELVESLGAVPVEIDAEAHDRLMARISHLPHVLANVLIAGAVGTEDGDALSAAERALAASGPSFRDATRVAGASSAVWTDIYLSNSDMLVEAIDGAIDELAQVREMLREGQAQELAAWNDLARARRDRTLLP